MMAALLAATPLLPQPLPSGAGDSAYSVSDRQFLQSAGASTLAALQFSSAVKDRTPEVTVRAYAESVIADTHQIRQLLIHLASREGVTLPERLSSQTKIHKMELQRIAPAQVDVRYARLMESQDQTTIQLFRREADQGTDPLLKQFARDTLPRLQGMLSRAREIAETSRH
ncbi:MAG TPA: DUF4142 domain-containing protein [Terriglobales bacterium]|nr:DUF4142 domain-containing protein [Terriglobales bacterium]